MALPFFPLIILLFLLSGCASHSHELASSSNDPFYQEERGDGYGKKKILDRIYQLDPGQRLLKYSTSLLTNPPRKIAVLPFENLEGGDLIMNGVSITEREAEDRNAWSWTYANRLRKSFYAYLSLREFDLQSLVETDTVLKEMGITNPKKLYDSGPRNLGEAMGVDAVIYGKVTHYRNHYYLLVTQIVAGLYVKCISTRDGSTLFEVAEVRRDNHIRIATNPIDLAIASAQNAVSLRELFLARASDEVAREIVHRIPVVVALKMEKENALKNRVSSNRRVQRVKNKLAMANTEGKINVADGGGLPPERASTSGSRTHKVQKGDTLFKLAKQYYNNPSRWRTIYEANRVTLQNKDILEPGQVLLLPEL